MKDHSDADLLHLLRTELFTAVVGDVMDHMGYRHQFLPPRIRPLTDDLIMAGHALPVLEADCAGTHHAHSGAEQPFGLMFDALDCLEEDDIYIASGASGAFAQWGELMSTRARHVGAAGAVVDGYSRDTEGVLRLNFPTFSWGTYAQDQGVRGRVIDFGCRIEFANRVSVERGDIIFGDRGGVVVIPSQQAKSIVDAAIDKKRSENLVKKAIERGMPSKEAFETYGVM